MPLPLSAPALADKSEQRTLPFQILQNNAYAPSPPCLLKFPWTNQRGQLPVLRNRLVGLASETGHLCLAAKPMVAASLQPVRNARIINSMKQLYERIPIRFRISFMLVGLMTGTLLVASAAGFFPNEQRELLRGRAKLCESLAISGTALASSGNVADIDVTLQSIVKRDDQIVSIGFRLSSGELLVGAGPHSQIWDPKSTNSAEQMSVPIFRQGNRYGTLEVVFVSTGGFMGLNYWAPAWLLIVLIPACFVQYSFFLRRALDSLDPNGAVPQRVRDTFDHLAVGVLVTDQRDRILLVNRLFTETVGLDAKKVFGMKASAIAWIRDDESEQFPWVESLRIWRDDQRSGSPLRRG